jgi:hypothetical protein
MNETTKTIDSIISELEKVKQNLNITEWQSFELDFSNKFENRKEITQALQTNIGKETSGFYSIFDKDKCLYIGIGRPIWKRIKSHYYATNEKDKAERWVNFFITKKATLTIYWKDFSISERTKIDDKTRQLIEVILTEKYNPEFEQKAKNNLQHPNTP